MQKIVGTLVAAAGLLVASGARAGFNICNSTPNNVWISVGLPGDYDGMNCPSNYSHNGISDYEWVGWYEIDAGSCINSFVNCLNDYNNAVLAWAVDTQGNVWSGDGFNNEFTSLPTDATGGFKCCVSDQTNDSAFPGGIDACSQWNGSDPISYRNPGMITIGSNATCDCSLFACWGYEGTLNLVP